MGGKLSRRARASTRLGFGIRPAHRLLSCKGYPRVFASTRVIMAPLRGFRIGAVVFRFNIESLTKVKATSVSLPVSIISLNHFRSSSRVVRCGPVWKVCSQRRPLEKQVRSRPAVATSRRPEVACRLGRALDHIQISGTKEVRSAMWSTKASFNVSLLIESLALSLTHFVVIILDCLSGQ